MKLLNPIVLTTILFFSIIFAFQKNENADRFPSSEVTHESSCFQIANRLMGRFGQLGVAKDNLFSAVVRAGLGEEELSRLQQYLGVIDTSRPQSEYDIVKAMDHVFTAPFYSKENLGQVFPLTQLRRNLIRKKALRSMLKQDLTASFKELGLLQDPGMITKFRAFRREHRNFEGLMWASATTAVIYHLMSMLPMVSPVPIPAHIPVLRFGEGIDIPVSIIEKIKKEGFDAAYEDVFELYGRPAGFETAWNVGRWSYYLAGGVISLYFLAEYGPMMYNAFVLSGLDRCDAVDYQKTIEDQVVRDRCFESWRQGFEMFEGRLPDPEKFPEDREEYDREFRGCYEIPIKELRLSDDECS